MCIRDRSGGDLIAAVDAAHVFTALGYSTTGAVAADNFSKAKTELQRYLQLLQTAQSEGRLTATGADALASQTQNIIDDLP